jgi:phosphonatase-like hydrolase
MYKMVVFDMAGTTINENNIVYKTLQKTINEKGFDFSLEQVLAEGAGREKLAAINNILDVYAKTQDKALADQIYKRFVAELTKSYDTAHIEPIENALQLFEQLRKRKILVILNTGYNAVTAMTLLSKLGWKKGEEFDGLVTASDVKNNRPNPDMILLAMVDFEIKDAKQVIKVGDSIVDIEEGKNAGCGLTIGITTGAHTHDQLRLANPDYIIDKLPELLPILDRANLKIESHA